MLKRIKSDYVSWMILIGAVILLLEVTFFNSGLIFSLFISIVMVYLGRKSMQRKLGKLLFWGGIVFFTASVFNMMTFRFLLLAILIHFVIQFAQSKRVPSVISPLVKEKSDQPKQVEQVIHRKPLFRNILFGQQRTPDHVYEWNDINIQTGVGDTIIDLSYTVLPKGETVVFIRNFIGNVQIFVPYDYEVSVHHSVLMGTSTVFDHHEPKMFNQVLQMQTADYEKAEQKVKIFTSVFLGDIEVKRI
ncbi:cell wall-active antibiotics response protein LiaF [Bacillus sp. CGMCC 1.16607]|uniref:cell wall-active antibiotics response protein LiaF n=1 Tax=Bacillus sp. CGMCC 1.16607 TaxID=3351842 RepID=UPI00362DCB0C